ncbi:peptidoglycan-recognition protein LE-like [Macrosteles quadrilineatus]|uniref:peptidoglycan-recognition protein LE-like n=1 Tax=Macrosteles quadrilineatus TaxID=74068 RepID=UPI0023E1B582|nr:peptidoglycan-recognition protein LE-like [Macrosteles quadrilineatus]
MDKKYDELNEFLDQCINDALQETTGRFQVDKNHTGRIDPDDLNNSNRFKGFKEDEEDPAGEKMKDYERSPPYKIYQRPLTAEETRDFKLYEEDMGKRKPGQERPAWTGFDEKLRGFDKTEEFSKSMRNAKTSTMQTKSDYREHKQDSKSDHLGKKDNSLQEDKLDWSYGNYKNDTQTNYNVKEPKINPNIYYPPKSSEEKPGQEKWLFKPKFSKEDKTETGYQESTGDRTRRFNDPRKPIQDMDVSDGKQGFKRDAVESVKENLEPGAKEEEVKKELLKLRPIIMERASWGALPPMGKVNPMEPPADTIVFTLNTGTSPCFNEDECRRTVREIQARHMGKGLADIQYNFLVGGDGNLYEGRGWAFESGIKPEKQQGKNYNIAFIGNFQGDIEKIPPDMLGPVQELIVWGNAIRLLSNDTKHAGEYRVQNPTE